MASPWFDDLAVRDEDDCDEDDDTVEAWIPSEITLKLNAQAGSTLQCKVMLFCFGSAAVCFGERFLIGEDKESRDLGRVLDSEDSRSQSRLYRYTDEVLVCVCPKEVPPEAGNVWAKTVLQAVHAEQVVLLASFAAMRFLSDDSLLDSMPILRCVPTSLWPRDNLPCPFLEAPNTIVGCQAAVLTFCEFGSIRASVFVTVESRAGVDIESLQLYSRVLCSTPLKAFFIKAFAKSDSELSTALRRVLPPPSVYSSMFS